MLGHVDLNAWRIVDGRLYLNLNKDVQKKWLEDVPARLDELHAVGVLLRIEGARGLSFRFKHALVRDAAGFHGRFLIDDEVLAEAGITADRVRPTAVQLGRDEGYIALSRGMPEQEIVRWRDALHRLKQDGRFQTLKNRYAN